MNTYQIATDLLGSFLNNGGTVKTNCEVIDVVSNDNSCEIKVKANSSFKSKQVIALAGKGFLITWERRYTPHVSPLVVTYPAVSNTNFVRLSNSSKNSINHSSLLRK